MNDFISRAYNGLNVLSDVTSQALGGNDISVYLKIYLLLYADDTIVLAESQPNFKLRYMLSNTTAIIENLKLMFQKPK